MSGRDAGLRQVIADPGELIGGGAVGMLFSQGARDEALKVRSTCRQVSWCGPCFQSSITPSLTWSAPGRAVSAACTSVRCAARRSARVSSMPVSKVAAFSWR